MGYTDFFPHGNKSVIVRFTCDNCGNEVESEEIGIPTPNYAAEKASDSHNENEGGAVCEECDKDFNVYVYAGYADGYVEINDVDDDSISVEEIVDEIELEYYMNEQIDAIIHSLNYIHQFEKELDNLRKLNAKDLGDQELQETLQRQIFSGAITCLEDYLSTTLIQRVLNNETVFKDFVKTYKKFKDRKFDLSDIYDKVDTLESIVKQELVDIIYHDLPKVRGIYQDTLKINFPVIKDIMKIITNRHDMVHRNGKNKEGEKIEISKDVVSDVIDKVDNFVKDVETELNKIDTPDF